MPSYLDAELFSVLKRLANRKMFLDIIKEISDSEKMVKFYSGKCDLSSGKN